MTQDSGQDRGQESGPSPATDALDALGAALGRPVRRGGTPPVERWNPPYGGEIDLRISAENAAIVLANLIDNSARHGATQVSVTVASTGGKASILVSDDGAGISPSNRARIFEPFFTTRRDSGGTGMGLGIVLALLKAHDGMIQLVDSERGTRFEITLPTA